MTNLPTILRTSAVPFRQIDTVVENLFNDFFNTVSRTPFNTVNQKSNYPRVDIRRATLSDGEKMIRTDSAAGRFTF